MRTSTTVAMLMTFALIVAMATAETPVSKKILTYNAFLFAAPTPERHERRDAIIDALRTVEADVVCLQEVWIAEDVQKFMQELADVYQYSYSLLHRSLDVPSWPDTVQDPSCSPEEFSPFSDCVVSKCLHVGDADMNACLLTECKNVFLALSQKCLACATFLGLSAPEQFVENCAGTPAVGKPIINDPGLLLLSKFPMRSPDYTDFHPGYKQVTRRGYLSAEIDGIGTVRCTHLSSLNPVYSEPHLLIGGVFDNYMDQSRNEIGQLVNASLESGSPQIILGDLNTGPERPEYNITPEGKELYDLLTAQLNTTLLTTCSFCDSNTNNGLKPGNKTIDHVFVVDHTISSVERVLDKQVEGKDLSDHYGVLATIQISSEVTSAGDIASLSVILVTMSTVLHCVFAEIC